MKMTKGNVHSRIQHRQGKSTAKGKMTARNTESKGNGLAAKSKTPVSWEERWAKRVKEKEQEAKERGGIGVNGWYKNKQAYSGGYNYDIGPKNLKTPRKWKGLRRICLSSINSFSRYGKRVDTQSGPYFFKDNGANVLAVAHLDTVRDDTHFGIDPKTGYDTIWNAQLDYRLGAWMILSLFPSMGINMDILLTTGEEMCDSSARHFTTKKNYSWLAEFDRSGDDIVTYGYKGKKWLSALDKYRYVGYGSYSDISDLESLGVCGANWGVGYEDYHSKNATFKISTMKETARLFAKFYKNNQGVRFPHEQITTGSYNFGYHKYKPQSWPDEIVECNREGGYSTPYDYETQFSEYDVDTDWPWICRNGVWGREEPRGHHWVAIGGNWVFIEDPDAIARDVANSDDQWGHVVEDGVVKYVWMGDESDYNPYKKYSHEHGWKEALLEEAERNGYDPFEM